MSVPKNLKHRPIIVVEDYEKMDGAYANNTDAVGLSLGLAQWNGSFGTDLSAKVWRVNDDGKVSRQSEELPLHRIFDLAEMILVACDAAQTGVISSEFKSVLEGQGSPEEIEVCLTADGKKQDPRILSSFAKLLVAEQKAYLDDRFKVLAAKLRAMGY